MTWTSAMMESLKQHDFGWADSSCDCGAPAVASYLGRYYCRDHLRPALRGS